MSPSILVLNEGNVIDGIDKPTTAELGSGKTEKSAVIHRSLHHDPLQVISAHGNYLHLSNGQKILDASGGAAVACIGHGDIRCVLHPSKKAPSIC